MSVRLVLVGVAVVLMVGAGIAGAFIAGVGPFEPGGDEEDLGDYPTGTPVDGGGSGGDGGGSGTASDGDDLPAYYFEVTEMEECGQTCRDVTVELTNNRDEQANEVVVYVKMFAGNSTDSDDRVWQGKEEVGTMEARDTVSATKQVELSYSDGYETQQNGGWVTIRTTVRSEDVTLTFTERRQVA